MTENAEGAERPSFEAASRFLCQAGFGGNEADIEAVRARGFEGWFLEQIALPRRSLIDRYAAAGKPELAYVFPLFWEGAIHGPDQLRQRVAYALSQVIVVSAKEAGHWADAFVPYVEALSAEAFGNYGALLRRVTYLPAMGIYLSHLGNEKADPKTGALPDENYARELMQLFTIGLTPLTPGGEPLPGDTYRPEDVAGLASILTGLDWAELDRFAFRRPRAGDPRRLKPMDAYTVAHQPGGKRFLGYETDTENPVEAIDGAVRHLFEHVNVPPFVGRQLIQKLVTSNPSPAYVERVASAFAAGVFALPSGATVGGGERGDMVATVAAILFDTEARRADRVADPRFGRLREPTLRYAQFVRAFRKPWRPGPAPERLTWQMNARLDWNFGEQPWYAPSVFGSFAPDYQPPGSVLAAQGMASPEMLAVNAASVTGYMHRVADDFRRVADGAIPEEGGVFAVDLADARRAARETDPAALLALVERAFYHGRMPAGSRARIAEAMAIYAEDRNQAPGAQERFVKRRAGLALAMAMLDPAYAVQR